jgi:DNA-binding transcriptional LysR family regulator
VRRVGEIRWMVCASPDYLTRRGEPRTPADLSNHDCIAFEELRRYREWPFSGTNGIEQIAIGARFSVNTADGVIGGAIAGLGIARVLSYQAAASVRDGTLLPILTAWAPPPIPVQLAYAAHRQQPLKLRAFLDFVAPRLQERLRVIAEHCGHASNVKKDQRLTDLAGRRL